MGPQSLGGSCEGVKVSAHTQKPLMEGGAGGELQNLRGEHNGGGSEGKMERTHHKDSCQTLLPR